MVIAFESRIATTAERRKALGSFGDLGPGRLAVEEWQALGLELPDVDAMRRYRLGRVRAELARRDYAAALLYDPMNVRYATDSTNMQVWCMHDAVRYAFVATDGPVVLFDFHGSEHLSAHLPLVDEVRHGVGHDYFHAAEGVEARARVFAAEIAALVRDHGGGNRRLALDTAEIAGVHALRAEDLEILDGRSVLERARVVKSPDEIKAMRCALATCEAGIKAMQEALRPGISEQALWAELHRANIARGGEWIETRLLSSGARTNPWFQECSAREVQDGEILAFDTDLIGPYGYCADISRTWLCGDGRPSNRQTDMMAVAKEQIAHNTGSLCPGLGFFDFGDRAFPLPDRFRANRYSVVSHGVGLCDEYPALYYREDAAAAYDGAFEPGMTVCVESYIGEEGGPDGIKLEEQVLITETGHEVLSTYPLGFA
jgi:Xaa-Pro dipeptidase